MAAFSPREGYQGLSGMCLFESTYVDPDPGVPGVQGSPYEGSCLHMERANSSSGFRGGNLATGVYRVTWMCDQTSLEPGCQGMPFASVVQYHLSKATPFSEGLTLADYT